MDKDEWYVNRILWRAEKNNLFSKSCVRFDDFRSKGVEIDVSSLDLEGTPVFAFYDNQERWTVVTSREILGFCNGVLKRGKLDDIDKKVSVVSEEHLKTQRERKEKSNFLRLENLEFDVWVTGGSELFGLMNLLLMFPLKGRIETRANGVKS